MDTTTAARRAPADTAPTPDPARPDAPQLRTLLLTDLCDSTMLVERLGDGPAADLFRAHDAIVLRLQEQWRGRLIDRSDGLLLLFERPIDGLGFALDYARGLRDLGVARGIDLKARAGLHVGEVLTWRNSDAAVRVGAKPLEVEGLAKPMAGRLMTMARPGQILLSAIAEPLAHRAANELGERGQLLLWKSHGRWRFKGVPQTQEIFEVGEAGIAPLRAPLTSNKAWRDIPLWRRPAALATELTVLLVVVGVGTWFAFKPQPAIAFGQRDWVVVGDMRNLTGQPMLDETLEQAFRISLEQSRYVNVLSDMKARDTLARMRKPANTKLDRAIASEIAIRDGARAVIMPAVSEVGGRVRVSAQIVDPQTRSTVHTESADGRGLGSLLGSIDSLTSSLRSELGEAVKVIKLDSVELPMATTENLEALRAYAMGQKAYASSQYQDAIEYYRQATTLDARFALAWAGHARAQYALTLDRESALPLMKRAASLSDRLAPRERLYIEGWLAEFEAPNRAYSHWRRMATLYPDFYQAWANAAIASIGDNRFDDALKFATRAQSPRFEMIARAHDQVGRAQLGLGNHNRAIEAFDRAIAAGATSSHRGKGAALAAQGRLQEASAVLTDPANGVSSNFERISIAIEQERFENAIAIAEAAASSAPHERFRRGLSLNEAVALLRDGRLEQARQHASAVRQKALSGMAAATPPDAIDDAVQALAAALIELRAGGSASALKIRAARRLQWWPGDNRMVRDLVAVVEAERLCHAGQCRAALATLAPALHKNSRFQALSTAQRVYAAIGNETAANDYARRMARSRGLAYGELGGYQALQALNVSDLHTSMVSAAGAQTR